MININRKALALISASVLTLLIAVPSRAGGLFGDFVNMACGQCGAGDALDKAHDEIKKTIPPYKDLEEGASHAVNEALVQATAPVLQEAIARSRDDALKNGVSPVPNDIKNNLRGFIPDKILDVAMYRVQGGGDLSLQVNSIRYGEAQAITLDYVIVFKDQNDALYNPTLWAHELTHVQQYQDWGLKDFAIRYVRNYRDVESPAYEQETRYIAWVGVRNSQQNASTNGVTDPNSLNRPLSVFSNTNTSNMCGTFTGTCPVNGTAPVGTPCWCNTQQGPVSGSLVPTGLITYPVPPPVQVGLPSGSGMQVCGCWGPNPATFANEPKCSSGQVRINVCAGQCAPGHPPYAYVCN
ncbi:eCIS core domain-containing protein [Lelliottia nimipressuralis]|uniref:eCIS core domain-containing protein n=1 Tax=Lelliottia nimipressuralis TaxID=69220 RepID=UPI00289E8CD2|nr:DUF4157 domain-containing protein [Lelliottia nimipressuralis]